jgi:hypothetical protein
MISILSVLVFVSFLGTVLSNYLDDYVWKPDDNFNWVDLGGTIYLSINLSIYLPHSNMSISISY